MDFFKKRSRSGKILLSLENINLSALDKSILINRFANTLDKLCLQYNWINFLFSLLSYTVTIASSLIVVFVAIERNNLSQSVVDGLYWTTLVAGVLITVSNKLLHVLNLQKRLTHCDNKIKRLESEAWQFAFQSAKYSSVRNPPDRIRKFFSRIEKIIANNSQSNINVQNAPPSDDQDVYSQNSATQANNAHNSKEMIEIVEISSQNSEVSIV